MVPGPAAPPAPHEGLALARSQQEENAIALTGAEILQGPAGEARNLGRRRERNAVQWTGC